VEWVVIDASSINVVDVTSLHKFDELRKELAARGIVLATARAKRNLWNYFNRDWGVKRRDLYARYRFDTIKSAVRAFNNRVEEGVSPGTDSRRI
jgi:MFS superfamily sulfate permease-like transporter